MKRPIITTPQIRQRRAYRYSSGGDCGGGIGKALQAVNFGSISQAYEGGNMARLVRLDRSGNTELAAWNEEDQPSYELAAAVFREQLAGGYMGVAKLPDDTYEQVKELPAHVDLVMLRRPIVGG
jgi:hypothetical protein